MSNQQWKRPNALKHEVFAAAAIIPGEDRWEFEELHSSLIQEWQPDGPTEEDAVLDIAKWCGASVGCRGYLKFKCKKILLIQIIGPTMKTLL